MEEIIRALRDRFGPNWGRDEEANLQFSVEAEQLLRDLDGAHLIGNPELAGGAVTVRVWVDKPLRDLMSADRLAFEIFARLSDEVFYTERRFETKGLRYPFVTGSAEQGHIGALLLAGPHAADFAARHHVRQNGGPRFQA